MAGLLAFTFGTGCDRNVPDIFASIQEALCFIDYDIKCKHRNDFVNYINYESDCSTWYEDVIKILEAFGQEIKNRSDFKRDFERLEALAGTCRI